MALPTVPGGSESASPSDVEREFDRQLTELQAQVKSKKLTSTEFEEALRRMVSMKTNKSDPEAVVLMLKEIYHGSPHVSKPSLVKIKLPADNRIPIIIPNGHDDSMDKDMSADVGSWGEDCP